MDAALADEVTETVYISNVCETFGIPPVWGGAIDQPVGLTKRIMLLRSYKSAVQQVEASLAGSQEPPEWARDLVARVEIARFNEDRALAESAVLP